MRVQKAKKTDSDTVGTRRQIQDLYLKTLRSNDFFFIFFSF